MRAIDRVAAALAMVLASGLAVAAQADPALSVSEGAGAESSGSITFVVTLAPASTSEVTVRYATSGGTATEGTDYEASSGTLTFAKGDTEKTVSVAVTDDSADEPDETFDVTLSQAVNATLQRGSATGMIADDDGPPNVLFISIDDLNDWIEPLGGHPQTRTPNIARLAERGVVFSRAYTAAPLCNPSRVALLTGVAPYRSGVYENSGHLAGPRADVVHLPEAFRQAGYWAAGSGRIYHAHRNPESSWDEYWPSVSKSRPRSEPARKRGPKKRIGDRVEWGWLDIDNADTGDGKVAAWVSAKLREPQQKPLFLGCGFYRPHRPWTVPRKYFDRFPLESVTLPRVKEDDLADVPAAGQRIAHDYPTHAKAVASGKWRAAVQAYLATINFADDLLGTVLDALEDSGRANNTIVVLFGDHGWHLGEKEHWNKRTLWEEATRVPLIVYAPPGTPGLRAGTKSGKKSLRPVNLLDVYPTLLELAGLDTRGHLDGRSFVPLLGADEPAWPPTVTTHLPGNHAVRSEHLRYIRYADGSEELYDHRTDPMEWTNLASDERYAQDKEALKAHVPKTSAKAYRVTLSTAALTVGEGSTGVYTVALTDKPKAKDKVTVVVSGAAGDVSVNPSELVFNKSNGDAPQTVTVTAAQDDDMMADAAVTLTHTASGWRYDSAPAAEVTVTVTEDDEPLPEMSVLDASAPEGSELSFQVALVGEVPPADTVAVRWETADGTATAGTDYVAGAGVLQFASGETSKTLAVRTLADAVVESDETVTVRLSDATGASLVDDEATGTITDATPVPTAELSVSDAAAAEGAALTFEVTLVDPAGPGGGAVAVRWETVDGTATAGTDYVAGAGLLEFASGETGKSVVVRTLADSVAEGDETVTVRLSAATGARLADSRATGTISDATPLTARVVSAPAEHEGKRDRFRVRIAFSERIQGLPAKAFAVERGAANKTHRVEGRDLWEVVIRPNWNGAVTVTLPPPEDCSGRQPVCTKDGRPLSAQLSVTVAGPASATAVVDGAVLTLTWPTPRDGFAPPDGSDFAVRVGGAWRGVSGAAVHGRRAVLTLTSPALPGDEATVDYLGSAMYPLRAANGGEAVPWENLPVVNVTALVSPRAAGDPIEVARAADAARPAWVGRSLSLAAAGLAEADLAALAGASGLRRLDLSGNALTGLSVLGQIGSLESLDLSGNALEDLWPLRGLAGLRRLDLSHNRIVDISPLAELPSLEVLLLDGNRVVDVGPLTHMVQLENLGLAGNLVEDASPLGDLVALRRLDLGGNPVADLSPLGDLGATLMWLRLPDGAGKAPLHGLVRLRWLRQAGAGICLTCSRDDGAR